MNKPIELERRSILDFAFKGSLAASVTPWLTACLGQPRQRQETSNAHVFFTPVTVDFNETGETPHFSITNEIRGTEIVVDPMRVRDIAERYGIDAQQSDTVHLVLTSQTSDQLGTEVEALFLPERTDMTLAAGDMIALIQEQNGRPPEGNLRDQAFMSAYVSYLIIQSLAVLAARRGDITEAQIREISDNYFEAVFNGDQDIAALVRILTAPSFDA
ncbi:MAG: hypothetical protein UY16_C0066G0002 [Candidatus Gottesmanbacteria bacterium GW2011_GWA2_47_9]|uniref:Uncharacterized protein n=1 Tax=Candidatus Gottesmanbacteria bacterium GW2011_GWA2_47_9 TaxID=1618445 RepID=A0A0G1WUQ5_9BACT|nr:MAG: hypothetical protein UY16_C0066G0002 [Candidatus Gottesmanbacteria bacterium GW2011_GWA2_47_9]